MISQLSIIIALIVVLAVSSPAPVATNSASKGINPVQHSE